MFGNFDPFDLLLLHFLSFLFSGMTFIGLISWFSFLTFDVDRVINIKSQLGIMQVLSNLRGQNIPDQK